MFASFRSKVFIFVTSPVDVVVEDVFVIVWGSIPGSVKSDTGRQRLATAAMFFWRCVPLTPNCGGGPRHSLHSLP